MLVFAHRGESANYPENSQAAISHCHTDEIDGIELDIYQTGSNFVVFHDRWLTRLLNINKRVVDLTEQDLQQIKGQDGNPLPTMDWVISELADTNLVINIEIKQISSIDEFLTSLITSCRKYNVPLTRFIISSFNHNYLYQISESPYPVRLGLLLATNPVDAIHILPEFKLYSVHLDMDTVSESLIQEFKQEGLKVLVYTVDQEKEIAWLHQHQVDGIFADDPKQAAKFIKNLER